MVRNRNTEYRVIHTFSYMGGIWGPVYYNQGIQGLTYYNRLTVRVRPERGQGVTETTPPTPKLAPTVTRICRVTSLFSQQSHAAVGPRLGGGGSCVVWSLITTSHILF